MQTRCTAQTVITILQEKVGVPTTLPNIETTPWEELGVESLGLSETVSTLEIQLGIDLLSEQALQTKNVHELVALINQQA